MLLGQGVRTEHHAGLMFNLNTIVSNTESTILWYFQVVLVGDFNVAMTPKDVHPSISYEGLYSELELQAMTDLLADYVDVWRELHPDTTDQFTV